MNDLWRNFVFAYQGLQASAKATNTASLMSGTIFNDVGRAIAEMDKENRMLKKELKKIRKELDALIKDNEKKSKDDTYEPDEKAMKVILPKKK